MQTVLLSALLAVAYSQDQCVYTANNGLYVFNLTGISRWTLELEKPDHFYYYTPCRNGITCRQGNADFAANSAQFKQGANQCTHYLSVDHHEAAQYSFVGASWRFHYEDGELCDITQQPRKNTVYFHCNNVNNQNPALLESVQETGTCEYVYSIASTLACMPTNDHNANCQWRVNDGKSWSYLDLSALKGEVAHMRLGTTGYEMYYSICANSLHCYQQHANTVMSVVDNRNLGTCEHSLAVWEQGQVQPHLIRDEGIVHWTFHYWNGQTCSNGQQGVEQIRFFCDPQVEKFRVDAVYGEGNCNFDMNISTKAACLDQEPNWVDAKAWF